MKFAINRTKDGLHELQNTLHWHATIIKPSVAIGAFEEDLEIRVQSVALPEAVEELNKLELQGHIINYVAKTNRNGEIAMVFAEGTDTKVTSYFTRWSNARWSGDGKDTKGKQRLTRDLKADIRIQLMAPDDVVTQTYILIGVIPKFTTGATLAQTADPMLPNITWEYDDWHIKTAKTTW